MKKIFIANRGEILRRIAQTAKNLGIDTCSFAEAHEIDFMHGLLDDPIFSAVPLTTANYLDGAAVVAAAVGRGCDALHPGFGFLSENAAFAREVLKAGMIWIGPHPDAMDAMSSKSNAQRIAQKHHVPTVPGCRGLLFKENPVIVLEQVRSFAEAHGFPLLVKAALGGGGKGMRVVHDHGGIKDALERASSEALSAFGDAELIVEKYLPVSRHVEVQIMADRTGQILVMGDRDCSLQRRHQKIVEEAPAPFLSAATRQRLHDCARTLAAAVKYDNAGTVEFLVNWSPGSRKAAEHEFYFLEMNTRLQVEHPVTEQIFGVDLVAAQIISASGQRLPPVFAEAEKAPRGHSIEVRIYAEDPSRQFLPSPGPIWDFVRCEGPGIRWESGIEPGAEISTRFDPMIAKLVVWSPTREAAIQKLASTLKGSFYAGPPGNFEYLTWMCEQSEFIDSALATSYIAETLDRFCSELPSRRKAAELFYDTHQPITWLDGPNTDTTHQLDQRVESIFGRTSSAPAVSPPAQNDSGSGFIMTGSWNRRRPGFYDARSIRGRIFTNTQVMGKDEAKSRFFYFCHIRGLIADYHIVNLDGWYFVRKIEREIYQPDGSGGQAGSGHIVSPVPGKVIKVMVGDGTTVDINEKVIVLESMKMEYEISSPRSGKINTVLVRAGDQVAAGQTLVTWDE